MGTRFVILHHQVAGGEHWDLMLERGEVLLTWQLPHEPVNSSTLPMPASRIGDHRKAFLEYEGPISRDRGQVSRVDAGTVDFEEATPSRYKFTLAGGRLCGRFSLAADAEGWILMEHEGD